MMRHEDEKDLAKLLGAVSYLTFGFSGPQCVLHTLVQALRFIFPANCGFEEFYKHGGCHQAKDWSN
jgi:hypothetical protein